MKHPIPRLLALGALVAATLATYDGSAQTTSAASAPANGFGIQPRVALPHPYDHAIPAQHLVNHDGDQPPGGTGSVPAVAAAFRIGDIDYLPLTVQSVAGSDWYMQCVRYANGQGNCFRIAPAKLMDGLQISLSLSARGTEPILLFAQTALPPSSVDAGRQSTMIEAFMERYDEALYDIEAQASALRTGSGARARAPGSRKKLDSSCDDGGDCSDGGGSAEGRGGGGGGAGGGIPTVEVPGHREPDPTPFNPLPDYQPTQTPPPPPQPKPTGSDQAAASWRN